MTDFAYSLTYFDKAQNAMVIKRFQTMFEAASQMQALLQDDQTLDLVTLRRRVKT